MLNVLELFSGTHSVGKVAKELGWDVVSLDLELPADHQIDIMNFDYKQYPQNSFDIIWASPPCTYYSNLQNCWIGRKIRDGTIVSKEWIEEQRKESDKLIRKTLEIIDYFKPELWFMENPQRGQLKDREVVKGLNYYDVSYCMYSDWGYEKRTRIWTNKKNWNNLICDKSGSCGNMVEIPSDGKIKADTRKLHQNNCGNTEKLQSLKKHKLKVSDVHSESTKKHTPCVQNVGGGTDRLDRYRIPPDLIYSLFLE